MEQFCTLFNKRLDFYQRLNITTISKTFIEKINNTGLLIIWVDDISVKKFFRKTTSLKNLYLLMFSLEITIINSTSVVHNNYHQTAKFLRLWQKGIAIKNVGEFERIQEYLYINVNMWESVIRKINLVSADCN